MTANAEKPSLTAVAEALGGLSTTDASSRREWMDRLEEWAKGGFPEGAGRLVLDHAVRSFPPVDGYPGTPNEQLLRLLWNGKTAVAGPDVETSFPQLNEECRASAIRLLSELGTREASESLARILRVCASEGLPRIGWPFLLPLERQPRDADVLIPPLLDLLDKAEGAGPVHGPLLAYTTAGTLTPDQRHLCASIVARQASRAIDDLHRRLSEHGPRGRWEDDYVTVKTDAGLLLDLLGRLDQLRPVSSV